MTDMTDEQRCVAELAKSLWQNDRFNTNEPWEKVKGSVVEEYWTRKAKEAIAVVRQHYDLVPKVKIIRHVVANTEVGK
jgi:hypothetical protein